MWDKIPDLDQAVKEYIKKKVLMTFRALGSQRIIQHNNGSQWGQKNVRDSNSDNQFTNKKVFLKETFFKALFLLFL